MGYTKEQWVNRIAERSDMSANLVHLTRSAEKKTAVDVLFEILDTQVLRASTTASGYIVGTTPAVCFQDAPLHAVCQNVAFEEKFRKANPGSPTRYVAVGLTLPKEYAYEKGARPVVYDKTSAAKEYLPRDEWWRIVRLDLTNKDNFVDWTHEREWRAPNDLAFDRSRCTLLFTKPNTLKRFIARCDKEGKEYYKEVKGLVVMTSVLL